MEFIKNGQFLRGDQSLKPHRERRVRVREVKVREPEVSAGPVDPATELDFEHGDFWRTPIGEEVKRFATEDLAEVPFPQYSAKAPTFLKLQGAKMGRVIPELHRSGLLPILRTKRGYRLNLSHAVLLDLLLYYVGKYNSLDEAVEILSEDLKGTKLALFLGKFDENYPFKNIRVGEDFLSFSSHWRKMEDPSAFTQILPKKKTIYRSKPVPKAPAPTTEIITGDEEGIRLSGIAMSYRDFLLMTEEKLIEQYGKWTREEIVNMETKVPDTDEEFNLIKNSINMPQDLLRLLSYILSFVYMTHGKAGVDHERIKFKEVKKALYACSHYMRSPHIKNIGELVCKINEKIMKEPHVYGLDKST